MKKKILLINFSFIMLMFVFTNILHASNLGAIKFEAINNNNAKVIENLEVSIYKVTSQDENGNLIFEIGFENCNIDINDLSGENLETLKNYAKLNAEPIETKTTNAQGKFTLEKLGLGAYLLIQENNLENIVMQTMLVTLPELTVENGLKYEVTAKPKISDKTIEETPDEPVQDEELPATGTLDWIVPILAVSGLIIFSVSWLKVYSTSKKKVN